MTKPPSRLKNRGGGFMQTQKWIGWQQELCTKFTMDAQAVQQKQNIQLGWYNLVAGAAKHPTHKFLS